MRLSLKQVIASVLGATVAALALSFLGVGGTLLGVVVGSAAATVGTGLAFHSLERGHAKVASLVSSRSPGGSAPEVVPGPVIEAPSIPEASSPWSDEGPAIAVAATVPPSRPNGPRWPLPVVILLVVALTLGVVTVIELAMGRPISTAIDGKPRPAARTSIGDVITGGKPATTTSTSTTTTTRASTTTSRPQTTTTTSRPTTTTTSTSTTTTTRPSTTTTSTSAP